MRLQVCNLMICKNKSKVRRKPLGVATSLFIESPGRYSINTREVGIQNNSLAADCHNHGRYVKLPADRAGLPGKEIFIYIVPLDPAYKTEVRGHVPAVQRLAEGWSGNKNNQKENEKTHRLILRRMREDCQHQERGKFWGCLCDIFPAEPNISFLSSS